MMETIINCPICDATEFSHFLTCKDHTATGKSFNLQTCETCKLIITNPRPTEQDLPNYYVSNQYISHTGVGKNLIDRIYLIARSCTLAKKLKLINKYKHTNSSKLLDYGCGTGEFINTCKSNSWIVSGIEPSAIAREKSQHLTNQEIHSSLNELGQNEFDVITLWHVLEHVPDLEKTIDELVARLSKNGTMFIAVPNHESYDAKHYNNLWAAYDVPRHLWHFSKNNITTLLEKRSLKLKTINPMKLDSFYVSMLSEKYKTNNSGKLINLFKALLIGIKSNQKAKSSGNYSSLIYIFTK